MNTDIFIVHVKTEDIYKYITKDVETRFDTSNYEIGRPLPMGKTESIWVNERQIRWTNHEKTVGLRAKTYSYSKDNNDKDKKAKETKKCVIKWKLKFKDYKKCLKASQIENMMIYLEKREIDVDWLKEDKNELIKIV